AVTERGLRPIVIRIFKWRRSKPVWLEKCEVARVPPVFPTGDVALRDGCSKSARLSDDPIRQQPAAASTGNAELLIIDVATFDHLIHAGHQVFVIVAGIMILNHVPKFLAVADV